MGKKKIVGKKKESLVASLLHYKKHIIPSVVGGGMAYIVTGVAVVAVTAFAAVWAGNAIHHHMSKKSVK